MEKIHNTYDSFFLKILSSLKRQFTRSQDKKDSVFESFQFYKNGSNKSNNCTVKLSSLDIVWNCQDNYLASNILCY